MRLTNTNLSAMLIAMPVAMCCLLALSIADFVWGRHPIPLFILVFGVCALVLLGGMFMGAAVIWRVQRDAPGQTLFALATPAERVLWIGGSFGGFLFVCAFLALGLKDVPWVDAFEPMMFCAITAPSIAMISAGRRCVSAQAGA